MAAVLALPAQLPAQTPPVPQAQQAEDPETLPPSEVARRNERLRPALEHLRAGDGPGAEAAFKPLLAEYPNDLHVLAFAAQAAALAGHDEAAIALFDRALAQHPRQAWPLRLGRMAAEARLGRWEPFDHELAELRAVKRAGSDPTLASSNGFLIDSFTAGGNRVQVLFFPLLAGPYHTLYRFLLPVGSAPKTSVQAAANAPGDQARCNDLKFQPYLDLESDDVDQQAFQQAHPTEAARGERSYSLDAYSTPCAQALVRFYNDGEPKYEALRTDLIRTLSVSK